MLTFSQRVIQAALSIPEGRVTTYGRLARACGAGPMASQSITGILAKAYNDGEKNIPFHRIVYANGTIWINDEYKAKRSKTLQKGGNRGGRKRKNKEFSGKTMGVQVTFM
jgi:alkylated DNA nucleotide flippase Atl1